MVDAKGVGQMKRQLSKPVPVGRAQSYAAILLAGSVYPSPLRRSLDVPALCLPVGERETLLDLWLTAIHHTQLCQRLTIAVSSPDDACAIERQLESSSILRSLCESLAVEVSVDAEECRGPGGALLEHVHDVDRDACEIVLVAEASCVPPEDLRPMLVIGDDGTAGIVGATAYEEPAGVYAFNHEAVSVLPQVKYLDIKEQVLPHLHQCGLAVRSVEVGERVLSMRTRPQYLEAVRTLWQSQNGHDRSGASVLTDRAKNAASARTFGSCLIGDDVTIEDGVVVYDSIILPGARCGAGSVIARSIIGHDADLPPRSMIKDEVINRSMQAAAGWQAWRPAGLIRSSNGHARAAVNRNGGVHRL